MVKRLRMAGPVSQRSAAMMVASIFACLVLMIYGWLGLNRLTALLIVASDQESYRDASFTVAEIVEPSSRRSRPTYATADIDGQDYRYTLGWEKGKRHWYGNRDWEVHRNQRLEVKVRKSPEPAINFEHSLDIIPREVHEHLTAHLLLALVKIVAPMGAGIMLLRLLLRSQRHQGNSRA